MYTLLFYSVFQISLQNFWLLRRYNKQDQEFIENHSEEIEGVDITGLSVFKSKEGQKAVQLIQRLFKGQKRKNGDTVASHNIRTAQIVEQIQKMVIEPLTFQNQEVQERAIQVATAAILINVLEEETVSKKDLVQQFGDVVSGMVCEVQDLSQNIKQKMQQWDNVVLENAYIQLDSFFAASPFPPNYTPNFEEQGSPQNLQDQTRQKQDLEQYLQTLSQSIFQLIQNPFVALIKLADKVQNMRTVYALQPKVQKKLALETLFLWCGVAERLGLSQVKHELEDLSFAVLDPSTYLELHNQLQNMYLLQNQQPREAKGKVPYTKESLKAIRNLELQIRQLSPMKFRPQKTFNIRSYQKYLDYKNAFEKIKKKDQIGQGNFDLLQQEQKQQQGVQNSQQKFTVQAETKQLHSGEKQLQIQQQENTEELSQQPLQLQGTYSYQKEALQYPKLDLNLSSVVHEVQQQTDQQQDTNNSAAIQTNRQDHLAKDSNDYVAPKSNKVQGNGENFQSRKNAQVGSYLAKMNYKQLEAYLKTNKAKDGDSRKVVSYSSLDPWVANEADSAQIQDLQIQDRLFQDKYIQQHQNQSVNQYDQDTTSKMQNNISKEEFQTLSMQQSSLVRDHQKSSSNISEMAQDQTDLQEKVDSLLLSKEQYDEIEGFKDGMIEEEFQRTSRDDVALRSFEPCLDSDLANQGYDHFQDMQVERVQSDDKINYIHTLGKQMKRGLTWKRLKKNQLQAYNQKIQVLKVLQSKKQWLVAQKREIQKYGNLFKLSDQQQRLKEVLKTVIPFGRVQFRDFEFVGQEVAGITNFRQILHRELMQRGVSNGLEIKYEGRLKSTFSIYQKMQRKDIQLPDIYDIRALRIIIDDENGSRRADAIIAVYNIQKVIEFLFKSKPEEYDDYILQKKKSGYQSIHLVVYGDDLVPVETQIRTTEMHDYAEGGKASHWMYKFSNKGIQQPHIFYKEEVYLGMPVVQVAENGSLRDGVIYSINDQDGEIEVALSSGCKSLPGVIHGRSHPAESYQQFDTMVQNTGPRGNKHYIEKFKLTKQGEYQKKDQYGRTYPQNKLNKIDILSKSEAGQADQDNQDVERRHMAVLEHKKIQFSPKEFDSSSQSQNLTATDLSSTNPSRKNIQEAVVDASIAKARDGEDQKDVGESVNRVEQENRWKEQQQCIEQQKSQEQVAKFRQMLRTGKY